jgi:VanZ family protein
VKYILAFLPPFLFLVVSIVLLTLPGNDLPTTGFFTEIPQFDKLVHIGMFGLLVYLFGVAFQKTLKKDRIFLLWVAVLGILYGVAMEFVQKYWVASRSFDLKDIVADTVGCLVAYVCLLLRFRKTWGGATQTS